MARAVGPFLLGIGESAQSLEAGFLHETEQLPERIGRLSGMADDHRRAEDDARDFLPHPADEIPRPGPVHVPVHLVQDRVRDTVSKRISDNFPKEEFIRDVYEKLGFYYEMAVGDGRGCTYSFSLGEFCKQYSLPIIPTDSALRILTRMGYIEFVDEMDYSARLLFTAGRDDLYRMHQDKVTDNVMNIILRNYSGIFTDYAYIDEHLICSRAGIEREQLYTTLMNLQSQGVVRYVPERRTPVITWTRERVDTHLLRFDPEVYAMRREEFKERIGAMMEYVTRETGCRSAMLLKYFGEHQKKPCMCCDLCQEKVQGELTRGERDAIMGDVLDTFHTNPDNPQKVYTLPYDRKKIDIVLHHMVAEGHILMRDGNIFAKK